MVLTIDSFLIFKILVVALFFVVGYLVWVINILDKAVESHATALEGILYALKELADGNAVDIQINKVSDEEEDDDEYT